MPNDQRFYAYYIHGRPVYLGFFWNIYVEILVSTLSVLPEISRQEVENKRDVIL